MPSFIFPSAFDPGDPQGSLQPFFDDLATRGMMVQSWDVDFDSARGLYTVTIDYIDINGAKVIDPTIFAPQKAATIRFQIATRQFTNSLQAMSKQLNIQLSRPVELVDLGTVATEPYVGYRDFAVVGPLDTIALESRNGVAWPWREKLVATCRRPSLAGDDDSWLTQHDAPHQYCECGIYAFNSPDHYELKDDAQAWAEVSLWGDILIGPYGYRAEFAYPKTIFLRDTGTKMARHAREALERNYGVPTFLVEKRSHVPLADELEQWLKGGDEHSDSGTT